MVLASFAACVKNRRSVIGSTGILLYSLYALEDQQPMLDGCNSIGIRGAYLGIADRIDYIDGGVNQVDLIRG